MREGLINGETWEHIVEPQRAVLAAILVRVVCPHTAPRAADGFLLLATHLVSACSHSLLSVVARILCLSPVCISCLGGAVGGKQDRIKSLRSVARRTTRIVMVDRGLCWYVVGFNPPSCHDYVRELVTGAVLEA